MAKNIVDIVSTENWEVGFDAMGALMGAIIEKVPGLNVYNLLDPYPLPEEEDGPAAKRKLGRLIIGLFSLNEYSSNTKIKLISQF